MELKKDFTLREIAGDYIVIPTGENYLDFGAVISLNETGAFLWNQLSESKSSEELSKALAEEYGIDIETASADTAEFVSLLNEYKLLSNE